MLHSENTCWMQAPAERIYRLAAPVEHWPDILPHYRWVTLLHDEGDRRIVEMAARRGKFPVRWVAEEVCFPEEPRITFRHIEGVTRGMEVEWRFVPRDGGTQVTIAHDLDLAWPLVGPLVARRIIAPQFIEAIAGQTLARIRDLAEAEERLAPGASR